MSSGMSAIERDDSLDALASSSLESSSRIAGGRMLLPVLSLALRWNSARLRNAARALESPDAKVGRMREPPSQQTRSPSSSGGVGALPSERVDDDPTGIDTPSDEHCGAGSDRGTLPGHVIGEVDVAAGTGEIVTPKGRVLSFILQFIQSSPGSWASDIWKTCWLPMVRPSEGRKGQRRGIWTVIKRTRRAIAPQGPDRP